MNPTMRTISVLLFCLLAAGQAKSATLKCKSEDSALSGHYYLTGVMEMGSELLLRQDGTFMLGMSYGSLDVEEKGCWRMEGTSIVLDVNHDDAPLFSLLSGTLMGQSRQGNTMLVQVKKQPADEPPHHAEFELVLSDGEVVFGHFSISSIPSIYSDTHGGANQMFGPTQAVPERIGVRFDKDENYRWFNLDESHRKKVVFDVRLPSVELLAPDRPSENITIEVGDPKTGAVSMDVEIHIELANKKVLVGYTDMVGQLSFDKDEVDAVPRRIGLYHPNGDRLHWFDVNDESRREFAFAIKRSIASMMKLQTKAPGIIEVAVGGQAGNYLRQ